MNTGAKLTTSMHHAPSPLLFATIGRALGELPNTENKARIDSLSRVGLLTPSKPLLFLEGEDTVIIERTIFMEPVAKQRARTIIRAGKVHSYTPKETSIAEFNIKQILGAELAAIPAETPVFLEVIFFFSKPKSAKKRVAPVTRPDWDNCGKLVSDAANKFAYDDDCQITTAIVKKRYCEDGGKPRIWFRISIDPVD